MSDGEYNEPMFVFFTDEESTSPIAIPERRLWAMLEALAIMGEENTVQLMLLGTDIAFNILDMGPGAQKTQEAAEIAHDALKVLSQRVLGGKGATREERTIVLCYQLIQAKAIRSWPEAAGFASRALGQKVNAEPWRKRVTRWADNNKMRPPEIYKRKDNKTDIAN